MPATVFSLAGDRMRRKQKNEDACFIKGPTQCDFLPLICLICLLGAQEKDKPPEKYVNESSGGGSTGH